MTYNLQLIRTQVINELELHSNQSDVFEFDL